MDALDAILLETAVPAAGLLLYALFLDIHESLKQLGLLPVLAVNKGLRSIKAEASRKSVCRKPAGCNTPPEVKRAA